ncbi:MAG: hypothetical protein FD177_1690 [Desulfovibrionaceae bacterium]|nr:MAG: hypothetical protein FD177_1690 [Desulfovibrionaceae bacterium]
MNNDMVQFIEIIAENVVLFVKPILTPMASAFFGAWFASKIAEKRDRRKREDEQVCSINVVVSSIAMNYNKALSIKRQMLDEFREYNWRHIRIRPTIEVEADKFHIDYKSISFLLENDCRMLLHRISVAEETFSCLVVLLNKRSQMHCENIQVKFEKNNIPTSSELTEGRVVEIIGVMTNENMKSITNEMYDYCDAAIEISYDVASELSDAAIKMFPGRTILKFER